MEAINAMRLEAVTLNTLLSKTERGYNVKQFGKIMPGCSHRLWHSTPQDVLQFGICNFATLPFLAIP